MIGFTERLPEVSVNRPVDLMAVPSRVLIAASGVSRRREVRVAADPRSVVVDGFICLSFPVAGTSMSPGPWGVAGTVWF